MGVKGSAASSTSSVRRSSATSSARCFYEDFLSAGVVFFSVRALTLSQVRHFDLSTWWHDVGRFVGFVSVRAWLLRHSGSSVRARRNPRLCVP